jgi:nucleoside-diphosphate-sugar epimerase
MPNTTTDTTVLVTGGSGFIAAHCIIHLLNAGYHVRTTVRSLKRVSNVQEMIKRGGVDSGNKLSFVEADLTADKGWSQAVKGCEYVLHVASPFPSGIPKDENELIIPAREGALRVLKASRDAGVKRVVLTSSFAAIGYGLKSTGEIFDEKNWTDPYNPQVTISAYVKSKTLAERAAWDFINKEGNGLEFSVINPVGVLGPVLGGELSTSIQIVKRLLDGSIPGTPRLSFGIIDVRDVADLHLRAMTNPLAKGERFLAIAGPFMTMNEIALLLKSKLGEKARRVPTRVLPDWLVRIIALFDPGLALVLPELGKTKKASNEKAKKLLGWTPIKTEYAIIATAKSLIDLGLVKR